MAETDSLEIKIKAEAEKAEEKDKKADDAEGENGEIVVVEEISE